DRGLAQRGEQRCHLLARGHAVLQRGGRRRGVRQVVIVLRDRVGGTQHVRRAGGVGAGVEKGLAGGDLPVQRVDVLLLAQHVVERAEQEFVGADLHRLPRLYRAQQRREQRLRRADHGRRRLIGLLETDEVRRLLVEIDPGY